MLKLLCMRFFSVLLMIVVNFLYDVSSASSILTTMPLSLLIFVEQAIKILTIVLIIYEFAVGEFPGRARIN